MDVFQEEEEEEEEEEERHFQLTYEFNYLPIDNILLQYNLILYSYK
jgi:hypothetical protein